MYKTGVLCCLAGMCATKAFAIEWLAIFLWGLFAMGYAWWVDENKHFEKREQRIKDLQERLKTESNYKKGD